MDSEGLYPRFSEAEFARRYAAVRAGMQEVDLPVLLVYGTPPFASSEVQYLANFPVTREAFLVFPGEGELALFVQFYNHIPAARKMTHIADLRWGGSDTAASVIESVKGRGLMEGRVGLVGRIPVQQYETLKQGLPRATFVDFTPQMLQLRLIKSDEEIEFLRKGAGFCDLAIEALEREVRPGITEHELCTMAASSCSVIPGRTSRSSASIARSQNPAPLRRNSISSSLLISRNWSICGVKSTNVARGSPCLRVSYCWTGILPTRPTRPSISPAPFTFQIPLPPAPRPPPPKPPYALLLPH